MQKAWLILSAGITARVFTLSMLQAPTEESDYDPFASANAAQVFPGAPACWKAAHSAKNEKALLIDLLS